jgi:hypothetical protein
MTSSQACILVLGQSNVGNHGPERAQGGPGVRVFHQGSFLPATDPLPGASGSGGSVWTRFAPKLIAQSAYDEVILVSTACGGTSVSDWIPGGAHHPRLIPVLDAAAQAGITFSHVVWHQGERDTLMATSEARYRDSLESLVSFLRQRGIDAPVVVCQASYRFGQTNNGVRDAQQKILDPAKGIVAGPDTDTLGAEYRYDDTHLDTAGQDLFATMLLDAFAALEAEHRSVSNG